MGWIDRKKQRRQGRRAAGRRGFQNGGGEGDACKIKTWGKGPHGDSCTVMVIHAEEEGARRLSWLESAVRGHEKKQNKQNKSVQVDT